MERFYGMHGHRVFERNGQQISGYLDDFYPNGRVRIRGTFNNGQPADSLVYFYANGHTEKRIRYLPGHLHTDEYDSAGRLVMSSRNKKGAYWSDYEQVDYYPDGRIQSTVRRKHGVDYCRSFFPDGGLKSRQTLNRLVHYYPNGNICVTHRWKRKRIPWIGRYPQYEFRITERSFDSAAVLKTRAVYEQWTSHSRQPKPDIRRSDWIVLLEEHIDGKRKIIARDVDTEKYFR
jgi:hypothetical protein